MAPERKRQRLIETVWQNLPKEIWCIIFSSLPKESRKNATRTCRLWLEIIRGDPRFSGKIWISWIELELLNSSYDWDNWPSLKTLTITDSECSSPKMALDYMKEKDFKKCPSLEKVTFGVHFELAELSQEIMKEIGTVLALTFNPKLDIDLFKLEHLDKLEIEMMSQGSDDIERNLKIMKMIGEDAKNIRSLIVGDESFYYPQIFETGFKNFGASLKVLTLQDGCFDHCYDDEFYDNNDNFINNVGTFFKSLMENCPNLIKLNLGSQYRAGDVDTIYQSHISDIIHGFAIYRNLFSMAGFQMLKELNVDFTDFGDHFECFLGHINDCNNIETLRLNGPAIPPSCLSGDMKAMKEKFKNLKKCEISFQTFKEYFVNGSWVNSSYDGYKGVVLHTGEMVKDLDETFADRSTEFKVLIMANTEQEKGFQIIKMPFKNSVITGPFQSKSLKISGFPDKKSVPKSWSWRVTRSCIKKQ